MTYKHFSWLRGWKLAIFVYIVLLLLSHLWRTLQPDLFEPEADQEVVRVHQVQGDSVLHNQTLMMAYRDEYSGQDENPPVVLLLHGSPIGTSMISRVIQELATRNRVIAPDFPGYDAPAGEIPDYSMEAFSVYMSQMLDSLDVRKVHVVGYSLGAGVAINMAQKFPEKVKSIDMLSGLGVQELELLGSYHLNHAIYGGQLLVAWLIHEAVPHFGLLYDVPFNIPYARSFYDSDQRPIRSYLKEYRKPMLIQHGREDGLVPLAAAQEHHRLVPQSELRLYDGGHAIVQSIPQKLAADINTFVERVESGEATTYAEAIQERKKEALKQFEDINFARAEGLTLYIMMVIIILSTFVSEDLACIGAGLLAARGILGFWPATIACFMGIIIGDLSIFLMGKWLGKPAVRRRPFRWFISEKDLDRSAEWFKVRGPMIIIGSRFVPGSRFPTYFSAGVMGMRTWIFLLYFIIAGIFWTPLLVGLAMLVGTELLRYFQVYQEYAILVIPAIIFLLFLFVKFILPAVTWRGRRLVLSRWRRLTRWEFWSPYLIYTPVVLYIVYLGMKYGNLTTFTAANPGIPDGGFIGESKSAILGKFNSADAIAQFQKINSELNDWEKFLTAREFMESRELSYPITVKPDVGQRGVGVDFACNEQELQDLLKDIDYDVIVQEYIVGEEYGVFYYQNPGESKGNILSITKKQLLSLTGDGKHTLEELILQDDRAVTLAKRHFKAHQDHIFDIPEEGETIDLVTLGTHARGARFFDISHLSSEKLTDTLDDILSDFDGFYFGRLDIRVPSEDDLRHGSNIKILEVNGVTSETTIIYDPRYSFWDAERLLMEQWAIAFKIGDENRKRGHQTSSVYELIQSMIEYRKRS